MAETGFPRSPAVARGALVQLIEDLGIIIPNIILFQYNPEKISRGFQVWNPFATAPQNQAAQTPLTQPFDPQQTFAFDLQLDATDEIEMLDPAAMLTGLAGRIAALRKLIEPTQGLFDDLIASAKALAGGAAQQAERPAVPVTLLVLGAGIVLPIRVTELSIEVTELLPSLYPLRAKAGLKMQVLTPDVFKCKEATATNVAIAAYKFTKLQDDALAIAAASKGALGALSVLPF